MENLKKINNDFLLSLVHSIEQKNHQIALDFLQKLPSEVAILILRINLSYFMSVIWLLNQEITLEIGEPIVGALVNLPENPLTGEDIHRSDLVAGILLSNMGFKFTLSVEVDDSPLEIEKTQQPLPWHKFYNLLPGMGALALPELVPAQVIDSYGLTMDKLAKLVSLFQLENRIIEGAACLRFLPFVVMSIQKENTPENIPKEDFETLEKLMKYNKEQFLDVGLMQFHLAVTFYLLKQLGWENQ